LIAAHWTDLAYLLHISPADIRRMSYREFRVGLLWLEDYVKEREFQARRAG
jgi:hypothetical protein